MEPSPSHRACKHDRRCDSQLHGKSPLNAADFRPFRRSNHAAPPSRNQVSRSVRRRVRYVPRRAVDLRRALLAAMTVAIVHAAPDPAGRDCPVETRLCPSTLVTTSTVSLPWTKTLVRSRETAIANLVASSMGAFLSARCEPAPGAPLRLFVGNHPLAYAGPTTQPASTSPSPIPAASERGWARGPSTARWSPRSFRSKTRRGLPRSTEPSSS
jgi:hypothetical protein